MAGFILGPLEPPAHLPFWIVTEGGSVPAMPPLMASGVGEMWARGRIVLYEVRMDQRAWKDIWVIQTSLE